MITRTIASSYMTMIFLQMVMLDEIQQNVISKLDSLTKQKLFPNIERYKS